MTQRFEKKYYSEIVRESNLEKHGDRLEKTYFKKYFLNFPNYELFWKRFIVPMTKRMFTLDCTYSVEPRDEIDELYEFVSMLHYSVFSNLAYARLKINSIDDDGNLEEYYFHLGQTFDATEELTRLIYLLYRLYIAPDCNTFKYCIYFRYYLLKGEYNYNLEKIRKKMFNGLFHLYSDDELLCKYRVFTNKWRDYRNVITHMPKIPRVVMNGVTLIPKSDKLINYFKWSSSVIIRFDEEIILDDFESPFDQCIDNFKGTLCLLDKIWFFLIKTMEALEEKGFYHKLINMELSL